METVNLMPISGAEIAGKKPVFLKTDFTGIGDHRLSCVCESDSETRTGQDR
jgi:hypothetical protein